MIPRRSRFTLFPYTTLFRSRGARDARRERLPQALRPRELHADRQRLRSEEHTSELQSHSDLVCRLLLEKKKTELEVDQLAQVHTLTEDAHAGLGVRAPKAAT